MKAARAVKVSAEVGEFRARAVEVLALVEDARVLDAFVVLLVLAGRLERAAMTEGGQHGKA